MGRHNAQTVARKNKKQAQKRTDRTTSHYQHQRAQSALPSANAPHRRSTNWNKAGLHLRGADTDRSTGRKNRRGTPNGDKRQTNAPTRTRRNPARKAERKTQTDQAGGTTPNQTQNEQRKDAATHMSRQTNSEGRRRTEPRGPDRKLTGCAPQKPQPAENKTKRTHRTQTKQTYLRPRFADGDQNRPGQAQPPAASTDEKLKLPSGSESRPGRRRNTHRRARTGQPAPERDDKAPRAEA